MTVFVHIGHHKTGTSSIQATLRRNVPFLRKTHSINYPTFDANHWAFAVPFLTGEDHAGYGRVASDRRLRRAAGDAVERFRKDAGRYATHVLSAEDFFFLSRPTLEKLRNFLAGTGHEIRIVAYVRHPAELASSKLNQRIVMGKATFSTFDVLPDFVRECLGTYVAVFGREAIIVRRFGERYFEGGGLIGDFLSVVHPGPVTLPETVTRNVSLTTPALRLIDALNRIAPRGSPLRGDHAYLRKIAGPKFTATREVVEAFVANQSGSLDYLASTFGIRFDEVDLARFPVSPDLDFGDPTLASIAAILNEQSRHIVELEARLASLAGPKRSQPAAGDGAALTPPAAEAVSGGRR